ncbi:MAG: SIS domain-containing protein [Thaumarchaeota archaeon]|nr:SIS domain-containing protein [Nitrososphaerota archaeon]
MKLFKEFASDYMRDLARAISKVDLDKVKEAIDLISNCRGTIWLIGNGGSAALASHMATDLQLVGKRAIALTDVAAITTYANDFHFGRVFQKQLELLARNGDLIIAISGSGTSSNIVQAIKRMYCHISKYGVPVIAVTGNTCKSVPGGVAGFHSAIHINIPTNHMGVSQDGHQVVLHMICYYLMDRRKVQ